MKEHAAFVSYGNDSIALIQHLHEYGVASVVCVFSDTRWAAPWWLERVAKGEELARSYGYETTRIDSMGLIPLVRLKKAWPMNGKQFCTEELKIKPAMAWLEQVDPDKEMDCVVGVRREESKARAQWPEHTVESDKHGGRDLWAPLARVLTPERDALIARAGFDVLPHRSMECYPCINANKADLRLIDGRRIALIEKIENEMGFTSKGKPRTMFRPYRHMGATGIREVIKWANSGRGEYEPPSGGCDGGWCGT